MPVDPDDDLSDLTDDTGEEAAGGGPPPPRTPGPPVGWLELFFDLEFVASVIVFSNTLSRELSWENAAWVAGSFTLIWWTWLATTMLFNRHRADDGAQRALVLLLMFFVTLITAVVGNGAQEHRPAVAGLFGLILICLAGLYIHTERTRPDLQIFARHRRDPMLVAAALFVSSVPFTGWPALALRVAGFVALLYPAVRFSFRDVPGEPPIDHHHLVERVGLFTIIVLGEAFVKVALTAADGSLDNLDFEVLAMQFITAFSVWSLYFDDVPHAGLPLGTARPRVWIISHLPLHLAIVATAVGAGKLLSLQVGDEIPTKYAVVTTVPLALIFVSLALVASVSPRRPRLPLQAVRLGAAVALLVVGVLARVVEEIDVEDVAGLLGLVAAGAALLAARLRRNTTVPTDAPA